MIQKEITFVSGLYFYTRKGKTNYPTIVPEIEQSLEINTWYKDKLICYADSIDMAKILQNKELYVHKVFDDAPKDIIYDSAHKMKHWIMLNAVKEFKDVVWIDWDTYSVKSIDDFFYNKCFDSNVPKFTFIENYWAVVNCAVYYLNEDYIPLMERSFQSVVSEPNDELLWKSVLPENICSLPHFWLNDLVINIWDESDFNQVTDNTYFLHLKNFEMLKQNSKYRERFH
ncbi:hypothetical protein CGC48_05575 [Capnocytophaga cynodegmi]|uniref:Glycosyltransferase n=1 Tax=Capnocytophaga cynodegmi TaxID=28189 RepID=A0A250E8W6_9FLAO|nr:hypothetical protein [Capnocytophaga cynodegmi]ATA68146.1 hypothetical protein CGC48_05575 [Capnocytophaga cynodegmi]